MKKPSNPTQNRIREEYDFSQGERGKYARRYAQGTNVVVLDPDVAKKFPNSKSVNASLRETNSPGSVGGMKASGVGREGGEEALRFFTEPKNVCIAK